MIKRILTVAFALVLLSSCAWFDACESQRRGEIRFTYPAPSIEPRVTLAERCRPLQQKYTLADWNAETETFPYNREWAECMGVGYK